MPRDGAGVYTLPAGNPVSTNTLIASTWANPTMSDIAVQLNNVLTRDGVLGPVGAFKLVDGAVATPGLAFNSEPGMGLYRVGSSLMAWAASNALTNSLDASSSALTRSAFYPRAAAGSAQLLLSNQPSGTTNRTDTTVTQSSTGLAFASAPNGTGTSLPFSFTTSGINNGFQIIDTGASGANIKLTGNGGTTPNKYMRVLAGSFEWVNSAYAAVIASLTDAGVFTANNVGIFSDERLKENITPNIGSRARLHRLQGMVYQLKDRTDPDAWEHGLIAQQVQEVYPHLVYENAEGFLAIKYMGFIGELINAINEITVNDQVQ